MKKTFAIVIAILFAALVWNVFFDSGSTSFDIDGDHVDGPLGALLAMVFAGGGALLAGLAMLFVGVVLAAVFTSLGIVLVGGLGLGALCLALAISPLLLPLLLPLALVWYFASRSRKHRMMREGAI